MDLLKKRSSSKLPPPKSPATTAAKSSTTMMEKKEEKRPISAASPSMVMENFKKNDIDRSLSSISSSASFVRQEVRHHVTSSSLVSSSSSSTQFHEDNDGQRPVVQLRSSNSSSPFHQDTMTKLGSRFSSASTINNGNGTYRSTLSESPSITALVPRQNGGGERTSLFQSGGGIEASSGSLFPQSTGDPMDLAIEATLQRTVEIFQRMVEQERAELVRMFPQLANVRTTAMADQGPGIEVVTERIEQPDGSILEVRRTRTKQVVHLRKSITTVNGVVQNTHARAVMEYQGPNGGYKLRLEEEADGGNGVGGRYSNEMIDSETEEDDDDSDRKSLAPSEFSESGSMMAVVPVGGRNRSSQGGRMMIKNEVPQLTPKPSKKTDKAWFAAKELVESEMRYVEKLKLLDQIFRSRVEKDPELAKTVAKDKLGMLFSNLGSLYIFHNDHLLPQLETKLRDWRQTRKICDVMCRQAPFLKIYGEYTGNYKKATKTFEDLKKANKRFASIIDEIEKMPECDHLPLSNHLICPVQRVTRYHLLMTEYLKNLDDGHPDKEDTKHAVDLTKEAASHANHMMRQLDKYKNVIEVQELLGSQIQELLTPSRELIKKGRLMKISARNGEHQQRFVFLFNDMLLICSEKRNIVLSAFSSGKYKLRAIFDVDGMNVLEGDNLDVENTFYVRSGNKIVEFYASEAKEKSVWMETLWSTIQEHSKRMQSFRKPNELGKKTIAEICTSSPEASPNHRPASSAGETCSNCSAVFNMIKKAYVCKSCTVVLCKKCCKKIKLHDSEKEQKVCHNCYEAVKSSSSSYSLNSITSTTTIDGNQHAKNGTTLPNGVVARKPPTQQATAPQNHTLSRKSILEVRPTDTSIWCGYLDLKTTKRNTWDRRYFALQQDLVLYTFRTDKDVCAKTSLPITGCRLSWVDSRQDSTLSPKDANAFKLEHGRRVYYLKADSDKDMAKCVAALELASQAQLPASGA